MSTDIFDCHGFGGHDMTGNQWAKARDAAKHPIIHRTSPYNKNYLAENSNSAEVEKHCPRGS